MMIRLLALVALAMVLLLHAYVGYGIKGSATTKSTTNKKKVGMFKAFWLTLIDPSNEESLKEEGKRRVNNVNNNYNKSKLKGRSLKG
jgi:hypothetical protein